MQKCKSSVTAAELLVLTGDVDHHIRSVEGGLVGDDHLWVHSKTSDGVVSEAVHTEEGEQPSEVGAESTDIVGNDAIDEVSDEVSHFLLILV